MHTLRYVLEQSFCELSVRGEFFQVDRDQHFLGLRIDVANINTTFMSEKNPITLISVSKHRRALRRFTYVSDGIDVDVVFGVLRMWHKRLDQELTEDTSHCLNLLFLSCSLLNPSSGFCPTLVETEQTTLASSLDELVRLCDELAAGLLQPGVCSLGLVEDSRYLLIFREVD